MAEWFEEEFRPFRLTDDGLYYQAVGTKDNLERIEAIEIIKALDRIADNENFISVVFQCGNIHNFGIWRFNT